MDKDFDTLKGKDITDARNELGYWWRLDNHQVICGIGGKYIFYRVGHNPNRVELITNKDNIVTFVKTALVFSM